ncbi:UNVERIFIED_ORG: hypothetical protein M2193_008435 [Bradyrhizobium japonicum]|uniref:hypothetical protein n=1 Tax=Bradyrhizobium diazoefficiens TaxID=1355477 RepID=UPI003481F21E
MTPSGEKPATAEPADRPIWPADASGEHRTLLQSLRDALNEIIDPLALAPTPEGSAARDPLEALVSRQVDATLELKGWWGIYSLQSVRGVRFGEAAVEPDDHLRAVRGADDSYFSARSFPVLLPHETRIRFVHADGHLWLGLDLPGETGRLTVTRGETIDFYLAPRTPPQRVLVDRLLARPWSAMPSAGVSGYKCRALRPDGADGTDLLLEMRPPHRLMRNLLRLPVQLFDGLERFLLAEQSLYWLRIEWTELLEHTDLAFLNGMRPNAAVFSDRLPGVLNAGLETRLIPRSRQIRGEQAVLIRRVRDVENARELYDRRACAATALDTYSVRPLLEHPELIAELAWDGPVSGHVSVEYEYVPLQGAHDAVKLGVRLEADGKERIDGGELLETWQSTAPARDDRDLWRAFASGLAGRGRAVTRREIVGLLAAQDFMGLNRIIEPDGITFSHRVGRIAGHAGVVPYVEILIPVQDNALSPRDRDDAAWLLEARLAQSGPIGHSFRIRLVETQAGA